MTTDVPLRCECGTVQGTVHGLSAKNLNNAVCYCIDCQTWAHHLGKADTHLDSHGGSHVVQVAAASITIEQGLDRIGLKRLSPSGLFRWYATCCDSPLANTLPKASSPIVGLSGPRLQVADESFFGRQYRVMGKYATGNRSALRIPDKFGAAAICRVLWLLPGWILRGSARRSPFFDEKTGEPIVQPQVLTREERDRARPSFG